MHGFFVSFEGIDGAGKSTQIALAAEHLKSKQRTCVLTREPGGTALGENLRSLLLEANSPIHPETEALLMFAARRQHIEEVIRPTLASGKWVLSDRFADASFAYQGGGRGVKEETLRQLENLVCANLRPDLTLLFDLQPDLGRERVALGKSPDRFERENADFFARVRQAYLKRAHAEPGRIVIIDATRTVRQIQEEIGAQIDSLCKY
ncbi:MAG: dTMP kinase [Burkholderiales bacterium]